MGQAIHTNVSTCRFQASVTHQRPLFVADFDPCHMWYMVLTAAISPMPNAMPTAPGTFEVRGFRAPININVQPLLHLMFWSYMCTSYACHMSTCMNILQKFWAELPQAYNCYQSLYHSDHLTNSAGCIASPHEEGCNTSTIDNMGVRLAAMQTQCGH